MYGLLHQVLLRSRDGLDALRWRSMRSKPSLAQKSFTLDNRSYRYFVHPYNHTWKNERAVELPVVLRHLQERQMGPVLEVGNVLSHYVRSSHDVVDKYERTTPRPIIRQDILDFSPQTTYSLIISISTIEHVGWDERPRQPEKALAVARKITRLLRPDGLAILTLPFGYNSFLDERISTIGAARILCVRRISPANEWEQTDLPHARQCRYGDPYKYANALAFLEFEPAPGGH